MERFDAIKAIVHLETTANYLEKTAKCYCIAYSKDQKNCLAVFENCLRDAHQLRMQQNPPETRKLSQLQSIVRHARYA